MNLQDRAVELKRALKDEACGPLIAAGQVTALAADWKRYKGEAGGKTCSSWLVSVLGKSWSLGKFVRRQQAVERIGGHAKKTWHHNAAVWALQKFQHKSGDLRKCDDLVQSYMRKHNANEPLSVDQVQRLCRAAKLTEPVKLRKSGTCEKCKELRKRLDEALEELRARRSPHPFRPDDVAPC